MHVVVSKFCDGLPLYRQSQMLARQGVTLDRSTLSNWVGRACWWLTPLYELIVGTALAATKLFADDTTLPVLDPGRGRTKNGRLWCYAVDDRPWRGESHPVAAYVYSEDHKGAHPAEHLAASAACCRLTAIPGSSGWPAIGPMARSAWRSAGRTCDGASTSSTSPPSHRSRPRCWRGSAPLYAIEARSAAIRPSTGGSVRQARSRPIVEALHDWLARSSARASPAASDLAKAIRYALRHWPGLTVFLEDGRVEMDYERGRARHPAGRPQRKNALFAGAMAGRVTGRLR